MAKIYNLFSTSEAPPDTFTNESANALLPIVRRLTQEAIQETDEILKKIPYVVKDTPPYKALCEEYDAAVVRWTEKIHRIGALAKGIWLVDFDTGDGYLCWKYPEKRVRYFHEYSGSYKTRKRVC
ncbi:MAG: DUF2203 family protein [Deltaproteobacteria bacterium]|nr:DUF2203 family protein [Deltaproteobacteria bacterium]